ncbi:MAG TPA: hypothetical protein DEA90_00840 [Opitutae bacterium]|nr:hypothetical protein [Opitutae bacterium]
MLVTFIVGRVSLILGAVITLVAIPIIYNIGRSAQLWRVIPERTVLVYTLFGKVSSGASLWARPISAKLLSAMRA